MKKPVTVVLVTIGLGLLLLSNLWPRFTSSESYWNDEQQTQFTEALHHAHELESRKASGKRTSAAEKEAHEQELAAAQAHRDQHLAKLAEAKAASQRPARICFWAGIAVSLAGLLAYRFLD
jgi:hypothetical protein